MDPGALQSDCCGARFMLNDILDGMRGRFDYDGEELRRAYRGVDFFGECFLPKCVETFLARHNIKTQFVAVETLVLSAAELDSKAMSKKVLDAVFEGFETAKKEFEVCSAVLVPKIAARLKNNKRFKPLFDSAKVEQEHYLRSKKLRNIEEESLLSSLVLTARDLSEGLSSVGQSACDLADQLRDAHGGIQYCIEVPQSLMREGWGSIH
jgi:hypothetical protein